MPKHLISFGSSCYFSAALLALLLLLSLDLRKRPPVTMAQTGIVLPSLAQCLARAVLEARAGVPVIPI